MYHYNNGNVALLRMRYLDLVSLSFPFKYLLFEEFGVMLVSTAESL